MYDIGLQLLGVRDDSKLMYALCSITQTDTTSHSHAKHDCGFVALLLISLDGVAPTRIVGVSYSCYPL